jgi:ribose transport system permease protein
MNRRVGAWLSRYAIFGALIVECVFFSVQSEGFVRWDNVMNILRQNSFTAILAAGMTFAILTAGIDLSVGSVVGLSCVLCADILQRGGGLFAAVFVGLSVGVVVGILNGLLITWVRIPPFIATLGMMLVVRGAAFTYTDARTISGLPASFAAISHGLVPTAIMLVLFAAAWMLLMRTPFGRHVYATGGNRDAAWLAGIRVNQVLLKVYGLCGLCAGLAGVLMTSRLNSGYPRAGESYELDAVTAVVVGGTSLFGGRGSIWGTLAGAFFIGILNNGLNLAKVEPYDQQIIKGVVLLLAASLDRWRSETA